MLEKAPDETTALDFYIEARGEKKRPYIYRYKKAMSCDHSKLKVIARGGIVYICEECNYCYHITGAYAQPWHNEVIMAMFTILGFTKEHGMNALGEVLRTPIGQMDGSAHKPVLPEGMSFLDTLRALEEVDVNTPDKGVAQLTEMIQSLWEEPVQQKKLAKRRERNGRTDEGSVPALQEREGTEDQDGSAG